MSHEIEVLREISGKLSQLIILTRLSNSKIIAEAKEELKKDPEATALLKLANGSLNYSQIVDKVAKKTKKSKITVKRRIADLLEKGALIAIRKGNETYCENSGLYD